MSSTNKVIMRLAYQYIGKMFEPRLQNYEELKRNLRRAGIDISLRMYLSVTVFNSALYGLLSFLFLGIITFLLRLLPNPINIPIAFLIIIPIIVAIGYYVYRLIYPSSKIGDRRRKIEAGLPSAASYMAAMSSAGVTPDEIFYSLSNDEISLSITPDAKKISRDIKMFGLDIIRAIENASRRSPSAKYTSFLEGINATNTSGGDLQGYFENSSKTLMRDKIQTEKSYIETLGLFAELFLVACIVMPTFAIVLIAMVALQGGYSHDDLFNIILGLGFALIPILQSMIIILVDGSQPQE